MSDVDRLWVKIKDTAREFGRSGTTLSQRRARALIAEWARELQIEVPPSEALDYYASELRDLSVGNRQAQSLSAPQR